MTAAPFSRCGCHYFRLTGCDRTGFTFCCREGEELLFEYRERSNRNDIALLHHFFLNERRPARLCAHDLPRPAHPSDMQEPFTDADYAPGGRLCTTVCFLLIFDLPTASSITARNPLLWSVLAQSHLFAWAIQKTPASLLICARHF